MNPAETHAQALRLFREGDAAQAATLLESLRADWVGLHDEGNAAEAGNDLGVAYYRLGRDDAARTAFEESLGRFEKLGDVSGQARALGNLGQLLRRADDKIGAEKNYSRAAELFHQAGAREFESDTYRALSQMQLQSGRWLEALASYDHALAAKGGSRFLRWFLQIPLKLIGVK